MYELGQGGKRVIMKKAEKYRREAIEFDVSIGAFYLGHLIERGLLALNKICKVIEKPPYRYTVKLQKRSWICVLLPKPDGTRK